MYVLRALCLVVLFISPALAHMTVHYDGATPIPVSVKAGSLVQINFPASLTSFGGAAHESDVRMRADEHHPHRLILEAIRPPDEAALVVSTATGAQYRLQLKQTTKKPSDIITVIDSPIPPASVPAQGLTASEPPRAPQSPVRQLWETQWDGDPRLARPGVQMIAARQVLLSTDEEHKEVLWTYTTRGFYGFTERITNKSAQPKIIWLPGIDDPYARLYSLNLDKHSPPLAPGAQPHMLEPGQSVLLHLVYEEVSD